MFIQLLIYQIKRPRLIDIVEKWIEPVLLVASENQVVWNRVSVSVGIYGCPDTSLRNQRSVKIESQMREFTKIMTGRISKSLIVPFEKVSFDRRQSILFGFAGGILEHHRPVPGLQWNRSPPVASFGPQRPQKLPRNQFLRFICEKTWGVWFSP